MGYGYLQFLLHAHLPFVRHPEYPDFLEEHWLFEAISETYLPLLRMLHRLASDQIPINLTISFSPTLISMLGDELLQERYHRYLEKTIELGHKELERTRREDPAFLPLAQMYVELFERNKTDFFDTFQRDILSAYGKLALSGHIEIITSPASYPFLPFYEHYPEDIHAQLDTALRSFERAFGNRPRGMWLPECGYFPGLENYLKEMGIGYFYGAAHSLLFSPEVPHAGVYAPGKLSNGVYAFGRDISSAALVWSPKTGYPSDAAYRDFYRDIGHDLPLSYIEDYVHLKSTRINTGYKYFAITGDTLDKRPYDRQLALQKVQEHAENYAFHHIFHMKKIQPLLGTPPLSCNPFTAELFGHWWFEGVNWIEAVLRECARRGEELRTITPSAYLKLYPEQHKSQPIFASWGNKGYAETWLEGSNDWIYRHIHMAVDRMVELTERFPDATGLKRRALNQAAREVLLTQSLDWSVILRNGTAAAFSKDHLRSHLSNFYRIYEALSEGKLSTEWLTKIERKNNCFPDIDYLTFARRKRKQRSI